MIIKATLRPHLAFAAQESCSQMLCHITLLNEQDSLDGEVHSLLQDGWVLGLSNMTPSEASTNMERIRAECVYLP